MIAKLGDLSKEHLKEICEIESTNMIPVLKKSGIDISKKDIENLLNDSLNDFVIFLSEKKSIKAFATFKKEENHIFIKSIQVNFQATSILVVRKLFLECTEHLKSESIDRIESVVQKSNRKSQILHKKLGFQLMEKYDRAARFWVSRNALIENLSQIS